MTRDELIRAVVTEIDRQSPHLISASMSIIDLVLEEAARTAVRNSHCRPCADDIGRAIRALKGVSANASLT